MYDVLVVYEGVLHIIQDRNFDDEDLLEMYGLSGGVILDSFDIDSGEADEIRRILNREPVSFHEPYGSWDATYITDMALKYAAAIKETVCLYFVFTSSDVPDEGRFQSKKDADKCFREMLSNLGMEEGDETEQYDVHFRTLKWRN